MRLARIASLLVALSLLASAAIALRARKTQAGRGVRVTRGSPAPRPRFDTLSRPSVSGLLHRRYRHARDRHSVMAVCAMCHPRRSLCCTLMSVR
jgi:cytochrome c553